ncbi:MAG: TRAP transporter large permease [Oscillospiraceae bacterium]|nr:TRAP transporter large permease [Oscillospiraceae bacterium]MBR6208524.1 TRAP transporter large permease [Oscillospiraceae bacterium]
MLGVMFGAFLVLMFLGIPIAGAMITSTVLPTLMNASFPGNVNFIMRAMVGGLDTISILAIPLFMLSGAIMAMGGISGKLFDVFAVFIGKLKAGMPCAVVITCLFYGAISGSGPATCAAVGAMCIPVLTELGYPLLFSAAVVATSAGLGVIIPPSIPFIMYGVTTGESVGEMFTAGVIPGILIALCLMIYCIYFCIRHGEDKEKINKRVNALRERGYLKVILDGFWALMAPVIILGGIYSGIVTPTEAACVSVFYAIIVSCFIYKTMKVSDIWAHLKAAVRSYAPICLLIGFAIAFGRILSLLKAPALISAFLTKTFSSRFMFLLALDIVMFFIGMFMDTGSAIAILGPILLVTAKNFGIDGIQFGIILVTNLAVGLVSPPVGLNLFVAAPMVKVSAGELGKHVLAPMAFFIVALLLITFVPWFSLVLLGRA